MIKHNTPILTNHSGKCQEASERKISSEKKHNLSIVKHKNKYRLSRKSYSIEQEIYKSIAIPIILYGVCYKTHTTIADEAGATRQHVCKFTSDDTGITKINRGVKKSCLHYVPDEYITLKGLANHCGDKIKSELYSIFMSRFIDREILIDTTKNLGIRARSFFAKFSDRALNDSYRNMMIVSSGVIECFHNVAGYFYTSCMKYHNDYDIPLLL